MTLADDLAAAKLQLTKDQAAYLGIPQKGPFKRDDYRY